MNPKKYLEDTSSNISMNTSRFDALFATLAQQHDGVEALLDSFFDFMHRKTDFYVVTRDPKGRKMGFLPGHAEQKVCYLLRAQGCSRPAHMID